MIGLYTWNLWGDVTDRFTGHPQSVDCMVKVSPSVVCTGCMDGSVRFVVLVHLGEINMATCRTWGILQ